MNETHAVNSSVASARHGRVKARPGRPFDTRLAEDLAALAALSRPDAQASPTELAQTLLVSEERATEILGALSTETIANPETHEVLGPVISLYSTDRQGHKRRVEMPANGGTPRRARLTSGQARAVSWAFNRLGIACDDTLRHEVESAFFPVSPTEPPGNDASMSGPHQRQAAVDDVPLPALMATAHSIAHVVAMDEDHVRQPIVSFSYQGDNDQFARSRRVVPRVLRMAHGAWLIDAFDLDARGTRTFLASRMQDPKLLDERAEAPLRTSERPDCGTIILTCNENASVEVARWTGARVLQQTEADTVIEVPYYRGDWLPRHILALGANVSYDDDGLREEVRAIARDDLRRALKRRQAKTAGGQPQDEDVEPSDALG